MVLYENTVGVRLCPVSVPLERAEHTPHSALGLLTHKRQEQLVSVHSSGSRSWPLAHLVESKEVCWVCTPTPPLWIRGKAIPFPFVRAISKMIMINHLTVVLLGERVDCKKNHSRKSQNNAPAAWWLCTIEDLSLHALPPWVPSMDHSMENFQAPFTSLFDTLSLERATYKKSGLLLDTNTFTWLPTT